MKFSSVLPLALAGTVLGQNSTQSLTEALAANNSTLSTLIGLLGTYPAVASSLSSANNITVLAPSNDALTKFLTPEVLSAATADPGLVQAVLSYHVLQGSYLSTAIPTTAAFVPTLLNNRTFDRVTNGQVVEVVRSGSNVTFTSGLKQKSSVTKADIAFRGGVIHIIDTVLTIPQNLSATAIAAGLSAAAGALTVANLIQTLEGQSDITVFAPNNDAFRAISSLTGNLSVSALSSVLRYHVIQNTIAYSSTLKNQTVTTESGESLDIELIDGSVYVNSAKVVTPDVLIANGVVHVIDNVLNPNNTASATPGVTTPAFSGASTASGGAVPFTSGVPTPSSGLNILSTTTASASGASSTTSNPAPRATAAIAIGALFGGAAMMANY